MRRIFVLIALVAIIMLLPIPIAGADQGPIGAGFSSLPPGYAGTLISEVWYGNTSNPSGNGEGVLPSLAPGPWKCANPADCAGPTDPGGSVGEFLAPVASGGAGTPDFANSKDPGPDFSG